jgi:hypothetical protein
VQDLAFTLRGPMLGPCDAARRQYWREAPLLGLTGHSEIALTERGIEFTTNIVPSSRQTMPGLPCYWHMGTMGVNPHPRSSDYACIPVTVTKIVY